MIFTTRAMESTRAPVLLILENVPTYPSEQALTLQGPKKPNSP